MQNICSDMKHGTRNKEWQMAYFNFQLENQCLRMFRNLNQITQQGM